MNDVLASRGLTGITRSRLLSGPNGIRAGWRFLCFYALWSFLDHLKNLVVWDHFLRYKNHPLWHPLDFLVWDGPEFVITLVTAFLIMRFVERRRWPFSSYGLGLRQRPGSLFLEGALWGFLTPTILILLLYLSRAVAFEGFALPGMLLVQFAVFWFVAMVIHALHDQFLFRGYPLFTFATGIGFWPASVLVSVLFGALLQYLFVRTTPFVQLVSISLISLFCCLSLRRTGSLWFAVGFDAMFTFAALVLYGSPDIANKGKSVHGHLVNLSFRGSSWLTGGEGGIQASVLVLPLLVGLFLVFHLRHRQAVYVPEHSSRTQPAVLE